MRTQGIQVEDCAAFADFQAAIGLPHEVKGTAIHAFTILRQGFSPSPELEKELRELITYAYGADVYAEMLAIRRQIREDREKKEREHRARQKAAAEATFWWSIAAILAALLIYIGYVLIDMVKARAA